MKVCENSEKESKQLKAKQKQKQQQKKGYGLKTKPAKSLQESRENTVLEV